MPNYRALVKDTNSLDPIRSQYIAEIHAEDQAQAITELKNIYAQDLNTFPEYIQILSINEI